MGRLGVSLGLHRREQGSCGPYGLLVLLDVTQSIARGVNGIFERVALIHQGLEMIRRSEVVVVQRGHEHVEGTVDG